MKCALPCIAVSLAVLTQGASAQVIYVDASLTSGANDGSSWGDAFQGADGLRSALAAATPGSEIWAAGGTYRAAVGAPVGFAVQAADVTLRGGFASGDASIFERPEPGQMPTILSGDALGNDDGSPASETDNALTVLECDHQVGWTMERIQVEAARELGFRHRVSTITDPFVVRRILRHIGARHEPRPLAPARPPPQGVLDFA